MCVRPTRVICCFFFFSSRRRHTRYWRDWSSDVCSSDLDRLKSVSKGYASFDYHLTDYKPADLVKMQILVNGEPVDALSMLVHRTRAEGRGRAMVEKMKELKIGRASCRERV